MLLIYSICKTSGEFGQNMGNKRLISFKYFPASTHYRGISSFCCPKIGSISVFCRVTFAGQQQRHPEQYVLHLMVPVDTYKDGFIQGKISLKGNINTNFGFTVLVLVCDHSFSFVSFFRRVSPLVKQDDSQSYGV